MMSLATTGGRLLRVFPSEEFLNFGYHETFGFIGERAFESRDRNRKLSSEGVAKGKWIFRAQVNVKNGNMAVHPIASCEVIKGSEPGRWILKTGVGSLQLAISDHSPYEFMPIASHPQKSRDWIFLTTMLLLLGLFLAAFFTLKGAPRLNSAVEAQTTPPLRILVEKSVPIDSSAIAIKNVPTEKQKDKVKEFKRAVEKNLGFLGLIGKHDLKNAVGGLPSRLKEATAGAGSGGASGSGGEVLEGIGQGVKRISVGNTGTKGLGGIGTKGAGGGLGGYGNSSVGSGEGHALSQIPLSKEMTLEGGLDRAVIQATIAKYLTQVRSCYEEGLQRRPSLEGQVLTHFRINGEGNVVSSNVVKSSLADSVVEGCIVSRMLAWRFPKPVGGVNVKVDYPFLLHPVKNGES